MFSIEIPLSSSTSIALSNGWGSDPGGYRRCRPDEGVGWDWWAEVEDEGREEGIGGSGREREAVPMEVVGNLGKKEEGRDPSESELQTSSPVRAEREGTRCEYERKRLTS